MAADSPLDAYSQVVTGVAAELTDFVSKGVDAKWNANDAFLMIGLKWRLARESVARWTVR